MDSACICLSSQCQSTFEQICYSHVLCSEFHVIITCKSCDMLCTAHAYVQKCVHILMCYGCCGEFTKCVRMYIQYIRTYVRMSIPSLEVLNHFLFVFCYTYFTVFMLFYTCGIYVLSIVFFFFNAIYPLMRLCNISNCWYTVKFC